VEESMVPERIDVRSAARELWISWAGGDSQRIALPDLRTLCPCASCGERRARASESSGLHVIAGADAELSAEVTEVKPVGRYAIQIVWGDGHNDGIYTYRFLREIG